MPKLMMKNVAVGLGAPCATVSLAWAVNAVLAGTPAQYAQIAFLVPFLGLLGYVAAGNRGGK